MADLQRARLAKSRLREHLHGASGVCGVGVVPQRDGWAVRVNVTEESDRAGVPREVAGVEVEVRVVGSIRAGA
ncbi:hypothetical protein OEB99_01325 [Actinotalea sp. M2MS4P-6]|uniref:hypothetical protein n=1 Tax=Actinotalea sp. M2MS4P-6 TaxID=2983762 RepID=UPI0021E42176|nr:hypothetical protein [Actinotalea sp. M2MS4P-6]MCV2392937.1 hypothetical protein [Actinotalea sp. M2MS4P-6]